MYLYYFVWNSSYICLYTRIVNYFLNFIHFFQRNRPYILIDDKMLYLSTPRINVVQIVQVYKYFLIRQYLNINIRLPIFE